jgi:hypothetical protein
MAGFCKNCGTPFDDATTFCGKCGTATGAAPVRPTAPAAPAYAALPAMRPPEPGQAAAVPQAAVPAKSSSGCLKAVIVGVVVLLVFGAIGIAGIWYVAHRVKDKVHDMGLDDLSSDNANANRGPALGGRDACSLLSKEDVGEAAKMEVVRAEHPQGKGAGCVYSVMGEMTDLVAKHAALLPKGDMTEQQRQQMEAFAKSIMQNSNAQRGNYGATTHPGEAPVVVFNVANHGAKAVMSMSRLTMGNLGPSIKNLPGLGDDAFDLAGVMIMARKGDSVLTMMYMSCPCTTEDVLPLARKVVSGM